VTCREEIRVNGSLCGGYHAERRAVSAAFGEFKEDTRARGAFLAAGVARLGFDGGVMDEKGREAADLVRMVSVPEAARLLGLGRTTTWDLVRTGRLRSVYVERRRLVPIVALDLFVAELMAQQANGTPQD